MLASKNDKRFCKWVAFHREEWYSYGVESQRIIMETKQERRNRLARERYTQNEHTKKRYQSKARAAIPERNQKRKDQTLKKRKESWRTTFQGKTYDIHGLILESYEHEKTMLMKLESEELFWKSQEGQSTYVSYLARRYRNSMTDEEKKRYKEKRSIRDKKRRPKQIKRAQKSNPIIIERQRLRSNFSQSFKRYRQTKIDGISKMIGCYWSFFVSWLESKFTKKMKWENYGKYWHIDHIQPLAAFDVYNNEHMQKAWHYTNLRPLDAKENNRKRAKIITHQPELMISMC